MKRKNQNNETENIITQKRSYGLLIFAAVLLIVSAIWAIYARNTSYQESLPLASTIKEINAQIKEIEAGSSTGNMDSLKTQVSRLSEEKLALERPYSYGLTGLFLAILLLIKGIYNAAIGVVPSPKSNVAKLAQAGLLAALCYIGFAFFKFDIPVGPEKTAFHFGNVFCVLAALLLGGFWGGMAGAVGMTIADLTTSYVTSAPKTFLLKLCIGLIVGFVAHKLFKLSKPHPAKYVTKATIISCACGMLFNFIADPLVGYFYKMYLLGVPQDIASALAKLSSLTTGVNAVTAVIFASIFYLALRPALQKSGLFTEIS